MSGVKHTPALTSDQAELVAKIAAHVIMQMLPEIQQRMHNAMIGGDPATGDCRALRRLPQ